MGSPPVDTHAGLPATYIILMAVCMAFLVASSLVTGGTFYVPVQSSGITWESLDADYPDALFLDVSFLNSTYGWVIGQESEESANLLVLHTNDGGDSWQLQYTRPDCIFPDLDVVDESTVWIRGDCLLHTEDGGNTWDKCLVNESWETLTTVQFVNQTHGWTGRWGRLYSTADGGQSWQSVPGWTFENDCASKIIAVTSLDIWACGFAGIYRSTDGGETWKRVSSKGGWDMSFVSETEGWIVDDSRLAHMTDGENWTELIVPGHLLWFRLMGPYMTDIQFNDEDHGWVVGTETPVMYTPDGGANWYEQSVPFEVTDTQRRIMAVCCINETHGWAVGSGGVILRSRTANEIGRRLWGGSADVLFLLGSGAMGIMMMAAICAFHRYRHLTQSRNQQKTPAIAIESLAT